MGIQKFLEWPFGYGIGQGAPCLGFGGDTGMITIDTYYLSILLEYGIAGFIVYYGMFAIAIYEAGRRAFCRSETEDKSFLLPIAVSLFVFIVIKSVFSQQDNHPVIFMMLGALMALIASRRKLPALAKSAPERNRTALAITAKSIAGGCGQMTIVTHRTRSGRRSVTNSKPARRVPDRKGPLRRLALAVRKRLLRLRTSYLRHLGMDIHPDTQISLKANLDRTNPRGIHIGEGTLVAFGAVILTHDMSRP